MARYRLWMPVHIETHHGSLGPIDLSFPAGEDVEPKSEQEEEALKALVDLGMAKLVEGEPTTKKPAKPTKGVTDAPQ